MIDFPTNPTPGVTTFTQGRKTWKCIGLDANGKGIWDLTSTPDGAADAAMLSQQAAAQSEINALASKNAAEAAKTLTQLARDASFALGPKYVDEPTGRAAVADGATFLVVGSGDIAAYEYRRTNAGASVLIASYPSATVNKKRASGTIGKNLHNAAAADVALGQFPSHLNGTLSANAAYNTTGFIQITAGLDYSVPVKHYWVWYDSNKAYISGTSDANVNKTQTAPAGAVYMRASCPIASWAIFQVEQAAAPTAYEAFYDGVFLDASAVKDRLLVTRMLAEQGVTADKTDFLRVGKNLFNKAAVLAGFFMSAAGALTANAAYTVSDFIPVTPGTQYWGAAGASQIRFLTYFDSSKNPTGAGSNAALNTFTPPAGVAYARITVMAADINTFQLEIGAAASAYEAFCYKLALPNGVTIILPAPPDNSVSTIKLQDAAVTPPKTNFLQRSKNLFNKATVTVGFFMGTGGGLVANATYNCSDYIQVTPGTQYYGHSATDQMRMWCFFDANFNVVAGGSNFDGSTFTPPAGTAYARVTVYAATQDSFQLEVGAAATSFVSYGWDLRLLSGEPISVSSSSGAVSTWSGKSMATMGDSITAQSQWQPSIAAKLGLSWSNFGIGGTRISSADANAMWQDARINAISAATDLVLVLGGTNDWAQDTPLGAVSSTDVTTFYGALNVMIGKLMARFPAKHVMLMTTPYGELYNYVPRGWVNAYVNNVGLTTIDYAEAIRVACKRWGIPYIDIQQNAGWNTSNIRTYIVDDGGLLHPNATGGARMAEVAIGTLKRFEPLA